MSFPEHINPNQENAATAPYNFVPLAETIAQSLPLPDHDVYHQDRFSGVIHCQLETKTPLYTRAALEPDEAKEYRMKDKEYKKKVKADFFYIDPSTKQPVIPGSTLRGMLRTLIEIVTFSKPQPITDRQLFFRTLESSEIGKAYSKRMVGGDRNGDGSYPNVQAGYMERVGHDYYLRPAQKVKDTQFYRVEEDIAQSVITANIGAGALKNMSFENQRPSRRNKTKMETYWRPNNQYKWGRTRVWFKPVAPTSHKPKSAQYYAEVTEICLYKNNHSPGVEWKEGWFIASGWVPGPKSSRGKRLHWVVAAPEDESKRFLVQDIDIDAYEELGAGRSQTIEKQKMSVLPKQSSELIPCFYCHWKDSTGNERLAFGHTPMFRLPYEYSPRDLLPYTEQQLQIRDFAEAIFGWVDDKKGRTIAGRVSVCDAQVLPGSTQPQLLKADEPSLTPLLSSPKPTSFQHYLTQRSDRKDALYHYQDKDDTTLRGHKLYWHKNDKLQRQDYHDANAQGDSTQHTLMRPVNQGVTFAFDIHFENLATTELGALLWVLRTAGDGKHCLKVGMAKPLGLGSVSIASRLCLSGRSARYRTLFTDRNWQETPVAFESVNLVDQSAAAQLDSLHRLLQDNETVEVINVAPFVNTFEQYMLTQLGMPNKPDDKSFSSLPRIKTLLTLLQWPGPDKEQTKYMQGPNDKHLDNKFKNRPVLPTPNWFVDPSIPTVRNRQTNTRTVRNIPSITNRVSSISTQDILATMAGEQVQTLPTAQAPMTQPQSLDELEVNAQVAGVVVRVEQESVVVNIGSGTARLHMNEVWPPTRNKQVLVNNFTEGDVIQAWVKGRNKQGTVQLTMKKPKT